MPVKKKRIWYLTIFFVYIFFIFGDLIEFFVTVKFSESLFNLRKNTFSLVNIHSSFNSASLILQIPPSTKLMQTKQRRRHSFVEFYLLPSLRARFNKGNAKEKLFAFREETRLSTLLITHSPGSRYIFQLRATQKRAPAMSCANKRFATLHQTKLGEPDGGANKKLPFVRRKTVHTYALARER